MNTYSMSSAGKCARTLSAEKLGLIQHGGGPVPEYLRLAAREGERHEQYIREDLPEHGYESLGIGGRRCQECDRIGVHVELRVITPLGYSIQFVGHLDDYVMDLATKQVKIGEYKALGRFMCENLRDGVENHRTYATQISLYHASHETSNILMDWSILWALKNRDTGRIKVWDYPTAIISLSDIVDRFDMIEECLNQGQMAPCDAEKETADKYSCTGLCDEGIDQTLPVPGVVDEEVTNFRTALVLEEQAKELRTKSRGVFEAYLNASGRKSVKVDDMVITLVGEGKRKVYQIPDEIKKVYETQVVRPPYIRVSDRKEME